MTQRQALWTGLLVASAVVLGVGYGLGRPRARESLAPILTAVERSARDAQRPARLVAPISDAEENKIGRELARRFPSRPSAYVSAVGHRLLPYVRRTGIDYSFEVLDDPVENAFALPGGRIYVTAGMLRAVRTEAELAGVIAHEVAHVDLEHCIDAVRAQKILGRDLAAAADLLFGPAYSEELEREADAYGLQLAARAGYDPRGLPDLFDRLAGPEPATPGGIQHRNVGKILQEGLARYAATHPKMADRARDLRRAVEASPWKGRRFFVGERSHAARDAARRDPEDHAILR
jgi:predicted Zn-dependent protease